MFEFSTPLVKICDLWWCIFEGLAPFLSGFSSCLIRVYLLVNFEMGSFGNSNLESPK